jgi:hypothetical protein
MKIEIYQFNEIMVAILSTLIILKYCLSICSGIFFKVLEKIAKQLYNSLKLYQYPENEWLTLEAVNYRKIKIQYNKLLEKFNFKNKDNLLK